MFANTINKLTELNYCFIFDNVPFHHNKLMLKLITDSGLSEPHKNFCLTKNFIRGHKYLFTPPYSPNNNPIETIFGIIKFNFRNDYKSKYNENKNICIVNLIKNAIDKFNKDYNKEMITKIFIHSINYDYKDLEKELRDRLVIKNQK